MEGLRGYNSGYQLKVQVRSAATATIRESKDEVATECI